MYKPSENKCPRCKVRREEGYMFCDECGNKLLITPQIGFKPCPGMYKYKGE